MLNPVFITISNLRASLIYYAYCSFITTIGFSPSLSAIKKTLRVIETPCCNLISYSNSPSYVYGDLTQYRSSQTALYTFSYMLAVLPLERLDIIPIILSSGQEVSDISVLPSNTTFYPTSTSNIGSFVLSGTSVTIGSYSIKLTYSGYDSLSYSAPLAYTIFISTNVPLPAPTISSAQFSNSGGNVYVNFSAATSEGTFGDSTFSCDQLFTFVGASYSSCSFISFSVVMISFGVYDQTNSYLVPGNSITILANKLQAQCISTVAAVCASNLYNQVGSVVVLKPSTALIPSVIVTVPSQSGSCNNLTIDVTSSTGNSGRAWASVSWVVRKQGSSAEILSIQNYLNVYGQAVTSIISLPYNYLSQSTYVFTLILTNFLGYSNSGSGTVTVIGNPNQPKLTVLGGRTQSFFAYNTITITVVATVSTCKTTNVINYAKSLFLNNEMLDISLTQSVDPRQVILPPYSLQAGNTYTLIYNATAPPSRGYSTAVSTTSIAITITRGLVVALIKGGSSKQFPIDQTLSLDASSSYDQDSKTATLNYKWSCIFASFSNYGSSCDSAFGNVDTTESIVKLTGSSMSVSFSYNFQVTVTSSDGRSSSAVILVQPTIGGGVLISLTSQFNSINVNDKLSVNGYLLARYSVGAFWSVYSSGQLVSPISSLNSLTVTSQNFSSSEAASQITYPLSFSGYTFQQGRTYTFRLSGYPLTIPALITYAEISIVINSPPLSGTIVVSPSFGNALTTIFEFSSQGWVTSSSNYPLSYSFTYQLSSSQNELTIASISLQSYAYSTLPAGLQNLDYYITIKNYVYDINSAYSVSTTQVNSQLSSTADVTSVLSDSLSSSFSSGNLDGAVQVVNNVGSTVNAVDCTYASVSNCTELNRQACGINVPAVPNICGSCLSGFSGIVGSSNSPCFNYSSSSSSSVGSPCFMDADCFYGFCNKTINNLIGSCEIPSKVCPTVIYGEICSGNGYCGYFDIKSSAISSCLVNDVSCTASCVCMNDYSGSACNLNSTEAITRDSLRKSLCEAVLNITSQSNPTGSLLSTIVGSLQSSFIADEVITEGCLTTCINALTEVSTLAADGLLKGLNSSTVSFLTNLISTFVSKSASGVSSSSDTTTSSNVFTNAFFANVVNITSSNSSSSSNSTNAVNNAVNNIKQGLLVTIVNGESASFTSDYLQVNVSRSRLSDIKNTTLVPPKNTAQELYDTQSPTIILGPNGLDSCSFTNGYSKISISEYSKIPYQNSVCNSPILGIQTYSSSTSNSSRRLFEDEDENELDDVQFLITDAVLKIMEAEDFSRSLTLSERVEVLDFTPLFYIIMPFSSTQNFNFSVDLVNTPATELKDNFTLPDCTIYDDGNYISCRGCNISSYNNYNATFGCSDLSLLCGLSESSRRLDIFEYSESRYLASTDDDGGTNNAVSGSQFGSLFKAIFAEFSSVLTSNPFTNLKGAVAIVSFTAVLLFFLLIGMPFFMRWDRLDHDYIIYVKQDMKDMKRRKFLENSTKVGFNVDAPVITEKPIEQFINRFKKDLSYNKHKDEAIFLSNPKLLKSQRSDSICQEIDSSSPYNDSKNQELILQDDITRRSFRNNLVKSYTDDGAVLSATTTFLDNNRRVGDFDVTDKQEEELYSVGIIMNNNSGNAKLTEVLNKDVYLVNSDEVEEDRINSKFLKASEDPNISQAYVYDFLEVVLPSRTFLKDKNPLIKFVDNIYRRHDYSAMFYGPSLNNTRTLRWIALMRVILVGLFVDTTLFKIFYPDDGFCSNFYNRSTCTTTINSTTNRPTCVWTSSGSDTSGAEGTGSCGLREPPSSVSFTIILALLTLLIGIPVEVMIGMVTMFICSRRPDLSVWGIKKNLLSSSTRDPERSRALNRSAMRELLDYLDNKQLQESSKFLTNEIEQADRDFIARYTYLDFLTAEEETDVLLKRVRRFLLETLNQTYLPWRDTSLSTIIKHSKINSIMIELGINHDGSSVPLTFRQYLLYGTPRQRLMKKLDTAKRRCDEIVERILQIDELESEHRDACLMQYFVLEHFTLFKRFCLQQEFFEFNDTTPQLINPYIWLFGWIFTIGSLLFFIYWIFAWGVQNGGSVVSNWGFNFGIGAVQDIFFIQVVKIYIIRIIGVEAAKPQLRNIYHVLNRIAMANIQGPDFSKLNLTKHSVLLQVLEDDEEIEQPEEIITSSKDDFHVVQYLSGSCRASRNHELKDLASARLIRHMNDFDEAKCLEAKSYPIGIIGFSLMFIPTIVALVNMGLSDFIMDTLLPSAFSSFILFNNFLFQISIIALIVPYIIVVGFLCYRYGLLDPSIKRITALREGYNKKRALTRWVKYNNELKKSSYGYLKETTSFYLDICAKIIYGFSYNYIHDRLFKKLSIDHQWLTMNIPLNLQGRIKSTETKVSRKLSKSIFNNSLFDLNNTTIVSAALDNLPDNIRSLQTKIQTDDFKRIERKHHNKNYIYRKYFQLNDNVVTSTLNDKQEVTIYENNAFSFNYSSNFFKFNTSNNFKDIMKLILLKVYNIVNDINIDMIDKEASKLIELYQNSFDYLDKQDNVKIDVLSFKSDLIGDILEVWKDNESKELTRSNELLKEHIIDSEICEKILDEFMMYYINEGAIIYENDTKGLKTSLKTWYDNPNHSIITAYDFIDWLHNQCKHIYNTNFIMNHGKSFNTNYNFDSEEFENAINTVIRRSEILNFKPLDTIILSKYDLESNQIMISLNKLFNQNYKSLSNCILHKTQYILLLHMFINSYQPMIDKNHKVIIQICAEWLKQNQCNVTVIEFICFIRILCSYYEDNKTIHKTKYNDELDKSEDQLDLVINDLSNINTDNSRETYNSPFKPKRSFFELF